MLDNTDTGLIAEVKQLRARGDLHLGLPSMRCVGYRQAWEYLDGAYDRQQLREKGIAATRQLAKRQLTWLRSMPDSASLLIASAADPATGNFAAGMAIPLLPAEITIDGSWNRF